MTWVKELLVPVLEYFLVFVLEPAIEKEACFGNNSGMFLLLVCFFSIFMTSIKLCKFQIPSKIH